jgi:hypothetical protein
MTPLQYRAALDKLSLSQRAAGPFLGVDERTSRRWAADDPPQVVGMLLRLMVKLKLKPEDVA